MHSAFHYARQWWIFCVDCTFHLTFKLPLKVISKSFAVLIQIIYEYIDRGMTKDGTDSTLSRITLFIDIYSLRSIFRIWSMTELLTPLPMLSHSLHSSRLSNSVTQTFSNALLDIHLVTLTLSMFLWWISLVNTEKNCDNHDILVGLDSH